MRLIATAIGLKRNCIVTNNRNKEIISYFKYYMRPITQLKFKFLIKFKWRAGTLIAKQ